MSRFPASTVTESKELLPGLTIHLQTVITAKGMIEFDLTDGTGPVVMAMHGGIGGCDQARIMADWVDTNQFRILSPSRPGYLGTPLEVERICCPSLILHGTYDADVKFYDGVYAYEHIAGAERFWIEEGSHLGFWISPNALAAQEAAGRSLKWCAG